MFQPLSNSINADMMQQSNKNSSAKVSQKGLEAYTNAYDFTYTTSSGDKLTLSMDANMSTAYKQDQNGSSHMLKREFSYEMKFESNGLTKEDKQEIQKALEEAKPMMAEFFSKVNDGEENVIENFKNNLASSLKTPIEKIKNDENIEQIKKETADTISGVMNLFDINEKLFNQASKLFEEIFDSSKLLNFKV